MIELQALTRKIVKYRLMSKRAMDALLQRYSLSTSTELLQLLRFQSAKGILSEPITDFQLDALIENRDTDLVIWENGKIRYLLRDKIGQGSFGEVYHATEISRKAKPLEVAVKQVFLKEQVQADRFDREVHALQAMTGQPHLASYVSHGKITQNLQYLVMNYVQGPKLSDVIEASQSYAIPAISLSQLSIWLHQIVLGLKTLHQADVVHRDIKPDNIILNRKDQSLCIVDFGLARQLTKDTKFTLPGAMGTVEYMPFEMFDNSHEPQKSSDIYSLGAVVYELLTGVYPSYPIFPSSELVHWEAACQRPFSPPSFYRPRLPIVWDTLVMKCLEFKPEDRYADAGVLYEHMQSISVELEQTIIAGNIINMPVREHCVDLRHRLVRYMNGLKRGDMTAATDVNEFWEQTFADELDRPIKVFQSEMEQLVKFLSEKSRQHYQQLLSSSYQFLKHWKACSQHWQDWNQVTQDLDHSLYAMLKNTIIIPLIQLQYLEE